MNDYKNNCYYTTSNTSIFKLSVMLYNLSVIFNRLWIYYIDKMVISSFQPFSSPSTTSVWPYIPQSLQCIDHSSTYSIKQCCRRTSILLWLLIDMLRPNLTLLKEPFKGTKAHGQLHIVYSVQWLGSRLGKIFISCIFCCWLKFSFPEGGMGLVPKRGCLLTLAYYTFPRW
jgi:hypothetical protein